METYEISWKPKENSGKLGKVNCLIGAVNPSTRAVAIPKSAQKHMKN